jgi:predicted nucleic acid-binding protein
MGTVVIDSSVLLGYGDPRDRLHHASLAALLKREQESLVIPVSVLSEVLVGAFKLGDRTAARMEEAINDLVSEVRPIDREIAVTAAAIRARRSSIRLPDALVLATGAVLDAEVLTGDKRWKGEPGQITVLEV